LKTRIAVAVVLAICVTGAALALTLRESRAEDKKESPEFARTTIDVGMVVTDVDKSVKFYTDAIGFQEVKGFTAPADLATDAGLTDKKDLTIRVLVLGEGETATHLKLMHVDGVKTRKSENEYLYSQTGYRYLTVVVRDMSTAMERLKKASVKPLAKGPVPLPDSLGKGMFLAVVQDPDGNFVELVGPKK
jgi:lactoylglutathione lyase